MTSKPFPKGDHVQRLALVLQGGGALGSYQVGVFEALSESGFVPDWIAGTSIGAINGAIIAGNPPALRLQRLSEFWGGICHDWGVDQSTSGNALRQIWSLFGALQAIAVGQPGFFAPRLFPPWFAGSGAASSSLYDTEEFRATLSRVVDFDYLATSPVRLSLGAVHLVSGRLRYFDSAMQRLGPEHVMASGALPPGFPAVEVEGELYWDGGVYSNTPLEILLYDYPRVNTLCFMVDLFTADGDEPRTIPETLARQKDIQYASRSRDHIDAYAQLHNLRRAVRALYQRLPAAEREDPAVRALADLGCRTTMEIVHLTYRDSGWELSTKDADFSRCTLEERRRHGYDDARRAIEQAKWLDPVSPDVGVVVHDLSEPVNARRRHRKSTP